MRALLVAVGSRGDVQPFVVLAEALRSRGHHVHLVAAPNFEGWIRGLGFGYTPVGQDVQVVSRRHAEDLAHPLKFAMLLSRTVMDEAPALFDTIAPLAAEAEIMLGGSLDIAGPSLSEKHGIPYVGVMFFPGGLPSDDYPLPVVPIQTLPRWLNRLTWTLGRPGQRPFVHAAINTHRARYGLPPFEGDGIDYLVSRGPVLLAADPALAPLPADVSVPVCQTGFWFHDDPTPLPDDLEAFLAAGEAPIYVGFGSMGSADAASATRAIQAAVAAVGCRAVISAGWAGLGQAAMPEGVKVIGAVSHARLFPRMRAIVHHGGAGTTAAAARAGVPQVIVPHLIDQFYWAHRVQLAGIGPAPVGANPVKAAELARALSTALGDAAMGDAARRMGAHLQGTRGVEAAVDFLEARCRPAGR